MIVVLRQILATPFFENAGVLAVITAFPAVFIAWLAYKRAVRTDTVTAQAGISTFQSGTIQQVIDGLNSVIENLQEDNRLLRKRVDSLIEEVEAIKKQLAKEQP